MAEAAEMGGDERASNVTHFLLQRASVPYLDMLRRWIYEGNLIDPYHEFMVKVSVSPAQNQRLNGNRTLP